MPSRLKPLIAPPVIGVICGPEAPAAPAAPAAPGAPPSPAGASAAAGCGSRLLASTSTSEISASSMSSCAGRPGCGSMPA
eukprot:scaffold29164_cov21-Phaeocystis_antarctica.AAC.1